MARPDLLCAVAAGVLAAWPVAVAAADGRIAIEARAHECPARVQVVAAIEARVPRATTATGPVGRTLELAREPEGRELSLRLLDQRGGVTLERSLALGDPGAGEACEALAEAVAVVVVRHLEEIGYRAPAAAPPAPAPVTPPVVVATPPPRPRSAGLLGVGGAARTGLAGGTSSRAEVLVGLEAFLGRVSFQLGAGASSEAVAAVPGTSAGDLRLRAFPLRAAVGLPLRGGPGTLVPAAGLAADLLSFRTRGLVDGRDGLRLEPALELGASYLLVGRRLYLRAQLGGGWTPAPRDFTPGGAAPVFRTPDAYLRALVEFGMVLWKNPGADHL